MGERSKISDGQYVPHWCTDLKRVICFRLLMSHVLLVQISTYMLPYFYRTRIFKAWYNVSSILSVLFSTSDERQEITKQGWCHTNCFPMTSFAAHRMPGYSTASSYLDLHKNVRSPINFCVFSIPKMEWKDFLASNHFPIWYSNHFSLV